jgi:hypothetical protein
MALTSNIYVTQGILFLIDNTSPCPTGQNIRQFTDAAIAQHLHDTLTTTNIMESQALETGIVHLTDTIQCSSILRSSCNRSQGRWCQTRAR